MSRIAKSMLAVCVASMLAFTGCGQTTTETIVAKKPTNAVVTEYMATISAETAEVSGICGANLTWYYQDHVLVIEGSGPMTNYELVDDSVFAYGMNMWTFYETTAPWSSETHLIENIDWIIVGEGVTSIGDFAFWGCQLVSKIELPSTLTSIGDHAFSALEINTLRIPASVNTFGCLDFDYNILFEGDPPQFTNNGQPVDIPVWYVGGRSSWLGIYIPRTRTVYYVSDKFDAVAQAIYQSYEDEKEFYLASGHVIDEKQFMSNRAQWVKLEQP